MTGFGESLFGKGFEYALAEAGCQRHASGVRQKVVQPDILG